METLGCRDCGWVVTNVYACDDGCEMTAAGAACKGKCKEEWCDDGDECTIDWCLRGECKHERKSGCCPPPGCDDGDPCTTDYCDESGACQHTDNPACRCQNKNCDDGDRCTIDSCDSTTGSCVNARMPGCDTPDDNEDSSSMYYDGSGESDPNAQIAILTNGFSLFLLDKLDGLGYGATIIQTIDEAFAYPVLAIPSGGLSGLDTSDVFKTKLERYVSEGGILISFTQQRGTEFQALPGGQLSGYGWVEDESCQMNSVGITEYHPIFSGSGGGVLSINVDGFFTTYPAGATVLLSRVKNGQPAMVLYDYGDGKVLAGTIYSDMAASLYQMVTQESILLRDMFAWALSQDDVETLSLEATTLSIPVHNPYTGTADLPVFQIGDEVAFSIDVTNNGSASTNLVKFLVSDPHFNQSWVEVKKTIGAGKTEAVDFTFPTDGSSEEGVWTVLYFLYDGEEFLGADMGGRFTVGYEPADYSSFKAIVTIKDPEGNVILEQSQDITIAPGETGNIQVSLPDSSAMGIWSARYSVLMSDNTVLLSSLKRFARSVYAESEGGWNYQASKIGFDVVSDHDQVVKGSSETFYIHIYNRGDAEVTVSYQLDWSHWNIGERQTATVPAGSTVTIPHTDGGFGPREVLGPFLRRSRVRTSRGRLQGDGHVPSLHRGRRVHGQTLVLDRGERDGHRGVDQYGPRSPGRPHGGADTEIRLWLRDARRANHRLEPPAVHGREHGHADTDADIPAPGGADTRKHLYGASPEQHWHRARRLGCGHLPLHGAICLGLRVDRPASPVRRRRPHPDQRGYPEHLGLPQRNRRRDRRAGSGFPSNATCHARSGSHSDNQLLYLCPG